MPACLPEQLPWMARGSSPSRTSFADAGPYSGGWAPLWRSSSESPAFSSMDLTAARWGSSALCEAQATASSSFVKPNASAAPDRMSGRACKGLAEERRYTYASVSPRALISPPQGSKTARRPRWTLSTSSPRLTDASGTSSGKLASSFMGSFIGEADDVHGQQIVGCPHPAHRHEEISFCQVLATFFHQGA